MRRLVAVGLVLLAVGVSGAQTATTQPALLTFVKEGKLSTRLCVARPDGSHRRALFGGAFDQDWAPDGRFVVFYRPGEGFVRADVDGHVLSRLVGAAGRFDRPWHPRWSPTTDWIALTDGGGGGSTLVLLPAGGGTARVVLRAPLTSFSGASWMRDGRHLVFSSGGGSLEPGIYTVALDGSDLRLVVPGMFLAPEVSPDGSKLAYVRVRGPERRGTLFVSNLDGSGELRLTRPAEDVAPLLAWAPDGETIAFTRARGDRFEIGSVSTDGSAERTLLSSRHASYLYPAWRPARFALPSAQRPAC
jgi:Tol biopolymer transport system component